MVALRLLDLERESGIVINSADLDSDQGREEEVEVGEEGGETNGFVAMRLYVSLVYERGTSQTLYIGPVLNC